MFSVCVMSKGGGKKPCTKAIKAKAWKSAEESFHTFMGLT
jgi:hypothetical protein